MALVKETLKNNIKAIIADMRTREGNSDDEYADRMAGAIEDFVKSATITVQQGIPVSVSGGSGSTTSTGTATIS